MNVSPARRTIGSLTTWLSGGTPSRARADYWNGEIPWITAFTLKESEIYNSDQHLTPEAVVVGSKMAPLNSTLLLVRGSALHKEIRAGLVSAPVAFNQDVKALVPIPGLIPKYLTHAIRANEAALLRLVTSAGNTAGVLDTKVVQEFEILVPGANEQRAIVRILDDFDHLLASLKRLLLKKKAIKQGMMQELLTGRTRLPGFTDRWREVSLRDAGSTYGGLVGKSKEDFGVGAATFVTFMEVMEGARLLGHRLERVRVRPSESQNRVMRGDVLFNGSSETPEEVALATVVDFDPTPSTYLNSFCFGYRIKAPGIFDPAYLAYYFRSSEGRFVVSSLAQGATRYNISKTKLLHSNLLVPPIAEQKAIVEVLRDVETEIDALHARVLKTRQMKTGMMQQLLTGRTRLPVGATS